MRKPNYGRARARADRDQFREAIWGLNEEVRLNLGHANAFHDRDAVREHLGEIQEALRDYERALALAPDFAAAMNSQAWKLATAPDTALRDGARAVELTARALRLVVSPEHHATLAAAFAEAGRFEDAVRTQEVEIGRQRATGRILHLSSYRQQLELYPEGRPFRR